MVFYGKFSPLENFIHTLVLSQPKTQVSPGKPKREVFSFLVLSQPKTQVSPGKPKRDVFS